MASESRSLRADAVLVGVTFVWGTSFVVVKNAFAGSPPLQFLFWRFLIAAAILTPLAIRRARTPGLFRDGLVVGALLAGGMSLQVLGVPSTTASKAAFLTGLSVVLTPFAAYLRSRKLPSAENAVGVALAGAGFVLLTYPAEGAHFNRGDALVFACGVVFAFYIVELGERSARHDAIALTLLQLGTVAVVAGIGSAVLRAPVFVGLAEGAAEHRAVLWQGTFLWSVLYLGSVGTVGTFFGQTWAQARMSATHAAILFALEPVFAAILAAWVLGDRLGARGIAGALLVLVGIVVSETRWRVDGR
ncbi:MAG TPA: DMT family transporter [Thermoanaerobaculia bacterium]|nr:DMT family transporter [Thermoanaerobaculia bacterium]